AGPTPGAGAAFAERLPRPGPGVANGGGAGDAAHASLEAEIVHLDPGRRGAAGEAPQPVPRHFVDVEIAGQARERGAAGIVVEAVRVGPLEVAVGEELGGLDRGGVSPDVGPTERGCERVRALAEAVEQVHAGGVGR